MHLIIISYFYLVLTIVVFDMSFTMSCSILFSKIGFNAIYKPTNSEIGSRLRDIYDYFGWNSTFGIKISIENENRI